ncbi:MAG: AMP-binding protein [Acidimicrobiales bacterium]
MTRLVALDLPGGREFVDALRRVWERGDAVTVLDRRLARPALEAALAVLAPDSVIDHSGERGLDGAGAEPGDALVMTTSGSWGAPKAAVLTHEAVLASAVATSKALGVDPSVHRWICCLPLAHIGGLSVVTRALLSSTSVEVLARFDAQRVEALGRSGAGTHVSLVPTTLRRIDPSVFERILLGGAAPPPGLPKNVVTTYGMTETGSGVVYDGRPLEGVELGFGTGEQGNGAPGEILLRCPMQLRCYRDGSDPTISGPDARGGWLPTADRGHLDAQGALVVDGRLAEAVSTGGETVWPDAVEKVIATHPKVREVAVWKRPDPEWGERVVAWIVPTDPADPPTLSEIGRGVSEQLSGWSAPRELVLVPGLPKGPSGKLSRTRLS